MDQMNSASLVVATPMYGGQCFGTYASASIMLNTLCLQQGIPCEWIFVFNESLITRARNYLVKRFLETRATHLMFIDADIQFRPEDVLRMLQADADVLCGLYPKKEINWERIRRALQDGAAAQDLEKHEGRFVVNFLGSVDAGARLDQPLEILDGGTGFMMVRRRVFELLRPFVPAYRSNVVNRYFGDAKGDEIAEFFATSIDPERRVLLSEDQHFCRLARAHGIRIFAAPWAKLNHLGTYAFHGGNVG
jgi:hypothetical protein